MSSINLRMCCACKKVEKKENLIRVVKTPKGEIFIDRTGKINGRGCYICKNDICKSKIRKTKGFNRSLKCKVSDDIYNNI